MLTRKCPTPAGAGVHPTDHEPIILADHGWLFAGGNYRLIANRKHLYEAMYVERMVPQASTRPFPIVMFHGGNQSGSNFTGTPDGRRGWAHDFLRAGYAVYVIDQVGCGRSGTSPELYGRYALRSDQEETEQRFTATAVYDLWPKARYHTQWPGTGQRGDPAFDRFFASQIEALADATTIERLNRDAGAALLDLIGPAVVLVHSQAGLLGWQLADARPDLVRGLLAIEPNGPPFFDLDFIGGDSWYHYREVPVRPWGITRLPLAFDPPLPEGETLAMELADDPGDSELARTFLQKRPARALPRLRGIPILMVTSQSSYHASYDHGTSLFLEQAGVPHTFVRLEDWGLKGNGHMMMLERNNHEVAGALIAWLGERGL